VQLLAETGIKKIIQPMINGKTSGIV